MMLKISAFDTLFFKDGKPFSMGEETWADGIFPPPPSVFYGALRALYFSYFPDLLPHIDNYDPTKDLEIKNLYFYIDNCPYFPIPLDLVKLKGDHQAKQFPKLVSLSLQNETDYSSSNPLDYTLGFTGDSNVPLESLEGVAILDKISYLSDYFNGKCPTQFSSLDDFVTIEPKIGIARNNTTLTSEDGMLYRVGMRRLIKNEKRLDFLVEFEGLDFENHVLERGYSKFGAENKIIAFSKVVETFKERKVTTNRFKIVLNTPGIFHNGWIPDFLNQEDRTGIFFTKKVRLIAAAIGKPKSFGGFDIRRKEPKPMYYAVPAGSVYYLETIDGNNIEISNTPFKLGSKIDGKEKEGWGIAYMAKV